MRAIETHLYQRLGDLGLGAVLELHVEISLHHTIDRVLELVSPVLFAAIEPLCATCSSKAMLTAKLHLLSREKTSPMLDIQILK